MSAKKNGNGGILPNSAGNKDIKKDEKRSLSECVVEFILTLDINEFENVNVGSIAREFNVNRSYLSQKFKSDKKLHLRDYILMVKILRATSLLAGQDEITIDHLAKLMGYSNSDYFCRLFKDKMGTTPGRYKNYIKKVRLLKV